MPFTVWKREKARGERPAGPWRRATGETFDLEADGLEWIQHYKPEESPIEYQVGSDSEAPA